MGDGGRPAIGRVTIRRLLGNLTENEIDIQHRRENLCRSIRSKQRTDGSAADAAVDQFVATQTIGIGAAARHRPAILQRNDIGGRRTDIDQQGRAGRDEPPCEGCKSQPVRGRGSQRAGMRLRQIREGAVAKPDADGNRTSGRCDRLQDETNPLALRLKAVAQFAGHGHGEQLDIRPRPEQLQKGKRQAGWVLPKRKGTHRAGARGMCRLQIGAAHIHA